MYLYTHHAKNCTRHFATNNCFRFDTRNANSCFYVVVVDIKQFLAIGNTVTA